MIPYDGLRPPRTNNPDPAPGKILTPQEYVRVQGLTDIRRRNLIAKRGLIGFRKIKRADDAIIIDLTAAPIKTHEYAPQTLLATPEGSLYVANVFQEFPFSNEDLLPDIYTDPTGVVYDVYQKAVFISGLLRRIRFLLANNVGATYAPLATTVDLMILDRNPNDPLCHSDNIVYSLTGVPIPFFNSLNEFDYREMYDTIITIPFATQPLGIAPDQKRVVGNIEKPLTPAPVPQLWVAVSQFSQDPKKRLNIELALEDGGQ